MKSQILTPLFLRDPRTLSPLVQKIINTHQKNQSKQRKAQSTNHKMVLKHEKLKKSYQVKEKQKYSEVIERVIKTNKERSEQMKKQSKHVQIILEKFRKLDQLRHSTKAKKIRQRNFSSHKLKTDKKQTPQFFDLTQQQSLNSKNQNQTKSPRCVSNSLDLQAFYKKNYQKINSICEQIMKKSIERQNKADENRRVIQEKSRIRQINQSKILRTIKANDQRTKKEKDLIRKSIMKLELFEKRSENHHLSQSKRSDERKEMMQKHKEQQRMRKQKQQQTLNQKNSNYQKILVEKQKQVQENKQNNIMNKIQNKMSKRLKRTQNTQSNFNMNRQQYQTKISSMYRKDREHWGFLTSVNQFKDVLIEKNIYSNSQLSLLK